MRLKVLLLAAIFAISVMGFYSPAQAADGVTPYANIMTWAGWTQTSKERTAWAKSDTEYAQTNFANAGTNMGIKGEKNGVGVQIEFGVKDTYEAFRSRHAFATYKVGELGFLIGQTLAPWVGLDGADLRSGDAMATAGSCYDGWSNQIRVSFFGAFVQIMTPISPTTAAVGTTGWDAVIPKIGAGYMLKTDAFSLAFNGVLQQIKVDKQGDTSVAANAIDGEAVTSWLVNVIFKGNFGPANLSAVAYYATNPGNMGFASVNGTTTAIYVAADNGFEDTTVMGGRVGAGFKAGMAKFNVGLGYEKAQNDVVSWTKDDDFLVYFANVQLFLQDNFYFAPEVKVVDYKKTTAGVKNGKVTYVGVAAVGSI